MLNMMMRADASRPRRRRASSNPETVGRLMSSTQMSGCSFGEHALAALGVGGFQDVDLGIVREQGAAARSNDAMIINDQNAHWHWSRTPASLPLLHRIRANTGAVSEHACRR